MNEVESFGGGSPFDAIKRTTEDGERWSGRELMPYLDYQQWRQFEDAISRARAAAKNVGLRIEDHFADARKITENSRGARRAVADVELTRYGAYLVAMNSDPRKKAVAEAQTYFAIKTREAELNAPPVAPPAPAELPATEPKTYPLVDSLVLIRQRFGTNIGIHDFTRTLRAGGVLRQDGRPMAAYSHLFWLKAKTGTFEVFEHSITPLYRLYESTKIRLEMAAQTRLPADPPGWPELPLNGES